MFTLLRKMAFISGLLASAVTTSSAAQSPDTPPKLIVAIAIDHLSADLFSQYRDDFTGGLARLSKTGVVFSSGYQSHAATETCPGHSTILTGSRPARTGIIANYYFNLDAPREDKFIYCVEDEKAPGTSSSEYVVSPVHLKVPTLGDRMKSENSAARVVSVAGKDRAAVMLGGHKANHVWWWDERRFTSYLGVPEPDLVRIANQQVADDLQTARPSMDKQRKCAAKSAAVHLPSGWSVGEHRFSRNADDHSAFRASPELDDHVLQLAGAFVEQMALGGQQQTDLLAIGLSATDYVAHRFGTDGIEMCLQLDALDKQLGTFFARLDAAAIDYVVVLTADHGGPDLPERSERRANPYAARVDRAIDPSNVDARLRQRLGKDRRLIFADASFGDYYVAKDLTSTERALVLNHAIEIIANHPQVAAVFTHSDLKKMPLPVGLPDFWILAQRARASFDPERSGDFVVLGRPWVTPLADPAKGENVAMHGSAWDYDRKVPILFWRKGIVPFDQTLPVETIDIMPTLAAYIGLSLRDAATDGRCLDLDAGRADSCNGRSAP